MLDSNPSPKAAASSAPAKKSKAAPSTKATAKKASPAATKPVAEKPKAAAPVAAKTVAKRPAKPGAIASGKAPKAKRKLVRDSFTMPQADFELIDLLKQRAMNFRHAVKKGELLRAGLQVLAALPDLQLQMALARITPLKTGRPKKAD